MVGVSNSLEWIGGETVGRRADAAVSLIPSRDFPDFKQLLFCTPRPYVALLPPRRTDGGTGELVAAQLRCCQGNKDEFGY